jgi:gluconolactonase
MNSSVFKVHDTRAAGLLEPGAQLERLATGAVWSEGPVWIPSGNCVLWSDIPNNRMLYWSAANGMQVWREQVEFTNGHTLDAQGNLLHCSHGQRALVRTTFGPRGVAGAGGAVSERDCVDEVLASRYQRGRLNSPNDVVVHSDGSIWFTDPPYGILSNHEGYQAPSEQAACHVFRFDPQHPSAGPAAMTSLVEHPNGLAFSLNEKTLYVSDTSAAVLPKGNHHIMAFDVGPGGQLSAAKVFATIEPGLPDGFRLDHNGWLYVSSLDSIQIYHPDGTRLAQIWVPEKVGNLCFGGVGLNELYICASTSLYRMALNTVAGAYHA